MSAPPADLERMILLEENGRLKAQLAGHEKTIRELVAQAQRDTASWVREKLRLEATIASLRGTDLPFGRAARRRVEREIAAKQRAEAQRAKRSSEREPATP